MSGERRLRNPNIACKLRNISLLDGSEHQPYSVNVYHQRRKWAFQLFPSDALHVRTIQWTITMILFYFYKFATFTFTSHSMSNRHSVRIKQLLKRLLQLPKRPEPPEVTSLSHFDPPISHFYYPGNAFNLDIELNREDPFKLFISLLLQEFSILFRTDLNRGADVSSISFIQHLNSTMGLMKDIYFTLALFDQFAKVHWDHIKNLRQASPHEKFVIGVHDFDYLERFLTKKQHQFLWHYREMMAPLEAGRPAYYLLHQRQFFDHYNDNSYDSSDDDRSETPDEFYASDEYDDENEAYPVGERNYIPHN